MADVRRIADRYFVSGQMRPDDVAALKGLGIKLIVNNRPDGEEFGQPTGEAVAAAAASAGVGYAAIPISGVPTDEAVAALQALQAAEAGPILGFCRSGMRSAALWALATVSAGQATPEDVVAQARDAGYDLNGLAPRLNLMRRN